jgi:hypothetical protein
MESAQTAKKEVQLAEQELLLRERLLSVLPSAIERAEDLFTNSRFNPHGLPVTKMGTLPQVLLAEAQSCVSLRESLQLQVSGSVGQLFLSACEERASLAPNSLGPRRLAQRLRASLLAGA